MSNQQTRLIEKVDTYKDYLIELCSRLIQTPSIDRESDPTSTTKEVCQLIVDRLEELGIQIQIIEPLPGHPNLVAKFGLTGGKRVVFNGHLDHYAVQPNEKWEYDPFSGKIVEGKIYGRGASDMKGGVASLITAFLILNEFREDLSGEVVLTLFSDEETGAEYGAKYMVDNCPDVRGDVVLSGEPNGINNVRFGERGASRLTVIAKGTSGHGATPFRGESANTKLIDYLHYVHQNMDGREVELKDDFKALLNEMEPILNEHYGKQGSGFWPRITVNIGRIKGGVKDSIISDHAQAEIDIRTPVGYTHEQVMKELTDWSEKFDGIEVQTRHYRDPNHSDVSHPFFKLLKKNAQSITGKQIFPSYSFGGTDLRFFRARGIPGFGYGPGAHNLAKANEYIEISDLIYVTKVNVISTFDYLASD